MAEKAQARSLEETSLSGFPMGYDKSLLSIAALGRTNTALVDRVLFFKMTYLCFCFWFLTTPRYNQ